MHINKNTDNYSYGNAHTHITCVIRFKSAIPVNSLAVMRKHCRCYVVLRPLLLLPLMMLLPLLACESGLHMVDGASVSGKFSYLNASLNRTEILPTVTLYKHLLHFTSSLVHR